MRRYIVVQPGARGHYAAPAALAKAGALESLYTDICANHGPTRLLNWWPRKLSPAPLKRLLGRRLPGEIPDERVHCVPYRSFFARLAGRTTEEFVRQQVLSDGFGQAGGIYLVSNLDLPIALAAKERGLHVVYEQTVNPSHGKLLDEEFERFAKIDKDPTDEDDQDCMTGERDMWAVADQTLTPSDSVRSSVIALGGDPNKVALVPYGIPADWLNLTPATVPGRVLFVGEVGLIKGNHYLAAATRLLLRRGVRCDVRVVGPIGRKIRQSPLFKGPTYVGQVPRSEVRREFLFADVFVLPTLSDSFGLAHLEALACGVPVITTTHCGSVVRNGIDGFVVPIRDPEALAEKIELLTTNREIRAEMSRNARARAQEYTWEHYQNGLLSALTAY